MSPSIPFSLEDLAQILDERVGVDGVDLSADAETPFPDLGLDSLASVEMQIAVEHCSGVRLRPQDAHHFQTPQALVNHVNDRLAVTRS